MKTKVEVLVGKASVDGNTTKGLEFFFEFNHSLDELYAFVMAHIDILRPIADRLLYLADAAQIPIQVTIE